jgi:hypothetical protein
MRRHLSVEGKKEQQDVVFVNANDDDDGWYSPVESSSNKLSSSNSAIWRFSNCENYKMLMLSVE